MTTKSGVTRFLPDPLFFGHDDPIRLRLERTLRWPIARYLDNRWPESCWAKLASWALFPEQYPDAVDDLPKNDGGNWCIDNDLVANKECTFAACWCGKMAFWNEEIECELA